MDLKRRSRSTPASTPAVDREFMIMTSNSKTNTTTTTIMGSNFEESNTGKEARDEECNYEAVQAPHHVCGDENQIERDDGIDASPVYWSVEYERQGSENCSTPIIDKKDSVVESGASCNESMEASKTSGSIPARSAQQSVASSESLASVEVVFVETPSPMAVQAIDAKRQEEMNLDELDIPIVKSEESFVDKCSVETEEASDGNTATKEDTSKQVKEDFTRSSDLHLLVSKLWTAETVDANLFDSQVAESTSQRKNIMTTIGDNAKLSKSKVLSLTKNIHIEDVKSTLVKRKTATKAHTERLLGSMASIKTERFDKLFQKTAKPGSENGSRKHIMSTIGDNAKMSKSKVLSLTKNIHIEDVKSTLVKSKTATKAHTERLFGSMTSIKTERFAKLLQKTAKPGSENESRIIQDNDSFESNMSTTSSWIASRRSALSEKSATSTVVSKKLEKIVKAENESADHLTIDRHGINTYDHLESVKSLESVEVCLDSIASLLRNSSIRDDMLSNEDLELVKVCVVKVPSLQDNPNEDIIADKFSIQDDACNEDVSVITEACEEEQSTPTVDQADKSIASLLMKKKYLNNLLATGSSKSKQMSSTVKKSILNKAHKVRKSKMIPESRIAKRSIEVKKEVGRGDQCEELNIQSKGSVEGVMSIKSNKTNSSKKSTKSIAEIYQEYRGVNDSTPRAKNTRHHKTLWPTTKTVPEVEAVPGVEAVTVAKVATPTNEETPSYSEIFCIGDDLALETKMSTMSHSSGTSSVTSKGQSQIANSQIAPEEVRLPAAEEEASTSVQIAPEEVQLPAAEEDASTSVQIAPKEVQLPATKDVASSSEDVASQQVAIDVQQQRTPGKFGVAINCGVFNCVAGLDL